jgi:hypothetical protein
MAQRFNIRTYEQHYKRVLQYAPGMLGNMAVNFFLDRFRYQNWLGNTAEPWRQRKKSTGRNQGRAILCCDQVWQVLHLKEKLSRSIETR